VNAPLAEMFRYNKWANLRLIEACRRLTDEQLDAQTAGTFGSIRATLMHLVGGQQSFLGRLTGRQREEGVQPWRDWPGFDALAQEAARSSDALIVAAEALNEDSGVDLPYLGKTYRYPKSFFLVHAIEHGVDHRTEMGATLAHLGLTPPDLDAWAYAGDAGHGSEG
jgi:uncharacterized damage-inducible protein DinB